MLEKAVFSEYTTLNLAFGIMITKALEEKDHGYARFLAEKMCTLASGFDMGKYNECAAMLNVVTAENNVEGTFQVAKQLLNNVDTICDFQESQLYKHMKFQEVENPYTEEMKKRIAGRLQKRRRVCLYERIRTLGKIVIRELKLSLSSKWLYINKERCIVFARFFFYSKS